MFEQFPYVNFHELNLDWIIDQIREIQNSAVLRMADMDVKAKILLETEKDGFVITYRRVKRVNELVINGIVYDEKKGIIEFEHNLSAVIDGHKIEAGYDEDSYSYIIFDGERIAEKLRII